MKTFAVRNGDIDFGARGYATVTGQAKLKQDLSLALMEPVGSDRFHPKWGSVLPSYVGASSAPETMALIQGEVSRVVSNYMARQQREVQDDSLNQKKSRLTDDEVVVSYGGLAISQLIDRIFLKVTLKTRAGTQVTIVRSVEA